MVEKKTTKKETKKTTTSKKTTTPRKTTSSKIKITYNPVGFNEKSTIYFPLYKKNEEGYNVPLIEGLPTSLSFTKGQVMEVTKKQYEELQKEGCVETDEEYKMRKSFIDGMKNQYPKTFSALEVADRAGDLISAHESQRMIYNDKLIRVD